MYITFPTMKNLNKLKNLGIVGDNYRPISVKYLLSTDDLSIIRWFSSIAHVLLNYYYPAQNFLDIRETINYSLRYSLLATLGHKHGKSIAWAIRSYGKSPSVMLRDAQGEWTKISCFISLKDVHGLTRKRHEGFTILRQRSESAASR
ncbi:putative groupII intron reverse transcriptase /maturase (mitochondrion) [Bryopsis sp. KO-2023]|nr:putative groupII intron reverse transcriptase /maturase [Bryopsis sp. KO-2023]